MKYVPRAKHLLSQLKAAGTTMEEDELCLSVLNGLPGEFDMITTVLTVGDKVLTLEDTLALLVETSHQKSTSGSKAYVARPAAPAAAYKGQKGAGTKQKSNEIRKCHHCGKPGHLQADCWQKQREEGASGSRHQGQGFKRNQGNQGNLAATAYQICAGQAWTLDSGASTHITQSQQGMSNLRAAPADLHITFGNGTRAKVEAVGDLVLRIPDSDFETVTLSNVYHVPEATMKLFSIRAAVAKGINAFFSKDQQGTYCILEKAGKLMVKSFANGGIFGMVAHTTEDQVLAAVESPELWHRRYGHMGYDGLAKLAAGNLVSGMKVSAEDFKKAGETPCGTCITSKQHKASRPSSDSETVRPLELLHTDVCGPMQVQSLGGSSYLATYLDDYSKMSVIKPVKYKSEVPGLTKEVIIFMEKQSGQQLLKLRSDNGTEYLNRELGEFLKQKGH